MVVKKAKSKTGRISHKKEQVSVCWLVAAIVLAITVGCIAGWARYWYGYFVLGQGTIAGLFIPWGAKTFCSSSINPKKKIKTPGSMTLVLILFICFVVAQAIGFGMAQPWFDPVGWLGRVIQHGTKESVWGISLLGGAVARDFQMGVNGGFWIFLNLFDIFFMCFFLLIGINSRQDGKK